MLTAQLYYFFFFVPAVHFLHNAEGAFCAAHWKPFIVAFTCGHFSSDFSRLGATMHRRLVPSFRFNSAMRNNLRSN